MQKSNPKALLHHLYIDFDFELLWHLPTVVKDLHIFNLQLEAICISSNMFQRIGQLMKLIIVLQIQGAPILVPSCPEGVKVKPGATHFKIFKQMQCSPHVMLLLVLLLLCWFVFFFESFNKNWGSNIKENQGLKSEAKIRKSCSGPLVA